MQSFYQGYNNYGGGYGQQAYGYDNSAAQNYNYNAQYAPPPQWPQQQPPPQQHQQRNYGNGFPKKPKTQDNVTYHCEICELNCNGQDAFNAHKAGRKHAMQARKKEQEAGNPPKDGGEVRFAPYAAQPAAPPAGGKYMPHPISLHVCVYASL